MRSIKLRCDVVQDPFAPCSRCNRLRLDCKIESNFKRIGKRSRNAEMEREIIELRKQIASQGSSQQTSPVKAETPSNSANASLATTPLGNTATGSQGLMHHANNQQHQNYQPQLQQQQNQQQQEFQDQYMGSHDVVASLMDLRSSSYTRGSNADPPARRLEDVTIPHQRISQLFDL